MYTQIRIERVCWGKQGECGRKNAVEEGRAIESSESEKHGHAALTEGDKETRVGPEKLVVSWALKRKKTKHSRERGPKEKPKKLFRSEMVHSSGYPYHGKEEGTRGDEMRN